MRIRLPWLARWTRLPAQERSDRPWPLLPLLVLAAVLPAAAVLWFMGEAMRNERLASREKLRELVQAQLELVRTKVADYWQGRTLAIWSLQAEGSPAARFAQAVSAQLGDAVVLRDGTGRVEYPQLQFNQVTAADAFDSAVLDQTHAPASATACADLAAVARQDGHIHAEALALRAQGIHLFKAGQVQQAISVWEALVQATRLRHARDALGNFVVPSVQLRLLQLRKSTQAEEQFENTLQDLAARLRDYHEQEFPASQRLFLMQEVRILSGGMADFPTLEAESLAAEYLESQPERGGDGALRRSKLPGVWELASTDSRVTCLFREARVCQETEEFLARRSIPAYLGVRLLAPGQGAPKASLLLTAAVADVLPDWQLAMWLKDAQARPAGLQRNPYLWTGVAAVVLLSSLAWLSGASVQRQIRSTRLKNDLLATVSHELKTPLASIRALADTLLAGRYRDQSQVEEYLRLIVRENDRLSRLIGNFLSYNRLERGRYQFRMERLEPGTLVDEAIAALHGRLNGPPELDVKRRDPLPPLCGDRDALVTVLVNLLDNAWKYTAENRRIALSVYSEGQEVRVDVQDNGMGIDPSALPHLFERFYQVERNGQFRAGGCGLGLSIVKLIVSAHGGRVAVASQPGHGSTFSLWLPVRSST